jgi:hypothetical protein
MDALKKRFSQARAHRSCTTSMLTIVMLAPPSRHSSCTFDQLPLCSKSRPTPGLAPVLALPVVPSSVRAQAGNTN